MGEPIIIWPPDGGNGGDPCASLDNGFDTFYDCSAEYADQLAPGEVACCFLGA